MTEDPNTLEELTLEQMDDVGGGWWWVPKVMIDILGMVEQDIENRPDANPTGRGSPGVGFGGSDRRIKQDIKEEGVLEGLNLKVYSWEYKIAPGERFVGLMAQDLLERDDLKSAVFTFKDGPFKDFFGVDYASIGLQCMPMEAWDNEVNSLRLRETAATY